MRRQGFIRKIAVATALAVLTGALLATSALAVPQLGLQMERTEAPMHIGDERLVYELTVENEASAMPKAGDELTCAVNSSGAQTFAWLRNGQVIVGAESNTYTLTATDEGEAVQCRVISTKDPRDVLPGLDYAPMTQILYSRPVAVEPLPASPPPVGPATPIMGGVEAVGPGFSGEVWAATPSGTATVTKDSDILTDVAATKGTGVLTQGSDVVTGVTVTTGGFANGDVVTGEGIPSGTGIRDVEETAPGVFQFRLMVADGNGPYLQPPVQATASGVKELFGGARPFNRAQKITGPGIPPGTIILETTNGSRVGQELKLSNKATASGTNVPISATATEICKAPTGWSGEGLTWSYRWLRNGVPITGATGPEYTITEEDTEPPSFVQCEATVEDAQGRKAFTATTETITRPAPPPPFSMGANTPTLEFENQTSGTPVTVELELPQGEETFPYKVVGSGWSCVKTLPSPPQPGSASCTRSDVLTPQSSYPSIELVIGVGQNPPNPLITKARVFGGGSVEPAPTIDEYTIPLPAIPFGFKTFQTEVLDPEGEEFTQAGGHPFLAGGNLDLNTHAQVEIDTGVLQAPTGFAKVITTDTPPGFIGNPQALPALCESVTLVLSGSCPASSVVGKFDGLLGTLNLLNKPLYAINPEPGAPVQLSFSPISNLAYVLTPELRPEDGYAIRLVSAPIAKQPYPLQGAGLTFCSFGAKLIGDAGGASFDRCRKANEVGAFERPFLTLPTKCGDPASATTEIYADSWEGDFAEDSHTLTPPTGCEELDFEAEMEARPTTNRADSPSGLEFNLHIPQNEDVEGTATAHMKKAVVTLPEGLVINPSSGNGLGACTEAQLGMKAGVPDNDPVRCPDPSKIGSVSVTTPILDHPLPGNLYLATPHQNPFNSLIALYLVVESPVDGITIKLPGKVETNPSTGQVTSIFDQNPQAPVEDVELKLRSGAAAALRTPMACGRYTASATLTPWSAPQSGPPFTEQDSWQINRGAGGGACASTPPNNPSFEAGSASAIAGIHAPFVTKLRREDGTQQFSAITVTPPPGMLAKLAGTTRCSEAALAGAKSKSGKAEQSSPSCPPGSELGTVIAAAGAGPAPYQTTGKAYLAGPYKGAPLSIAILTPAVAGPFDLGVVVVRAAAYVDPTSAQVTVKSDPLPTILEGIPLDVRSASVSIDRPGFILNPTSCDPMAIKGELLSTLGQIAPLENRFQLAECGRLPFKPKLKLELKGKTNRGAFQGLKVTLSAKPGEANIARTEVTMPKSAFVAQEHINTVCTRVQFAADACPKGSIYGKAKATTPLLDEPLTGNVYLRSSNNVLPDLVIALKGPDTLPIEVELAGRTDSQKGALRNTFDVVPDAPVSKFTLELFGGKKGLIVNSKNLCASVQRASVEMTGQNGKERNFRPVVGNGCKGKAKKRRGGKRRPR